MWRHRRPNSWPRHVTWTWDLGLTNTLSLYMWHQTDCEIKSFIFTQLTAETDFSSFETKLRILWAGSQIKSAKENAAVNGNMRIFICIYLYVRFHLLLLCKKYLEGVHGDSSRCSRCSSLVPLYDCRKIGCKRCSQKTTGKPQMVGKTLWKYDVSCIHLRGHIWYFSHMLHIRHDLFTESLQFDAPNVKKFFAQF